MSIPVTILGGFLGAGKTTAVNHLLRHARRRVGVLVNDFGAISVDARLIEAAEGDLVALSNGCVCCAVGPDLGASLARVAARRPDRIVVEASGVADPWRVAQLVRLEPGVVLDAVLVLVDASSFAEQLADRWLVDTLERQLARADLILISKCDLATPAQLAATRAAVWRIRPDAALVNIQGGAVPEALLGGTGQISSRFIAEPPEHGFLTAFWPAEVAFDGVKLRALLASLPASVLRAKGFCRIGPEEVLHLLQLVGRRWTLTPWAKAATPGLVLIGTDRMPAVMFAAAELTRPG